MRAGLSSDALILGGGIVGWATAFALSEAGVSVTVVDADDPHAATQAGAGIVTLGSSQHLTDAYIELARAAIEHYPGLVNRLGELEAGETGYAQVGALHVAFGDLEAHRLPAVVERLSARRSAEALARADIRIISGEDARDLVPPLSPEIPAAVWYADAARVNGRLMRAALRNAAIRLGATHVSGMAAIAKAGERLIVSLPDGSHASPDTVVICAGAWTTALAAAIGVPLAIEPQRGQIAHFDWPYSPTDRWPSIETEARFYMLSFPNGRVVSGATRESGTGFDPRLTPAGMHEVLEQALRIAPGLGDATVAEFRVGLRPYSADGQPCIGAIPGTRNGWICAGHGPSGLTCGPYSGFALSQVITTGRSDLDLAPYTVRPERMNKP